MTQSETPNPPSRAARKSAGARRSIVVYATLTTAVALAYLAGEAAMPAREPPPQPVVEIQPPDKDPADAEIEAMLCPEIMPVERLWRYIVVHHSATHRGTLESITQSHRKIAFDDAGYHFIINNGVAEGTYDGQITPTPRWFDQRVGAHCRVVNHPEFNDAGIGICLIGNFDLYRPTEAQMVSLERLVTVLRRRYDVPIDRIVGHRELKATDCPGKLFPMDTFLMDLRRAYVVEHSK